MFHLRQNRSFWRHSSQPISWQYWRNWTKHKKANSTRTK